MAARCRTLAGNTRMTVMKSIELAGEALIRTHEGNQQIAMAVWDGLRALVRRLVRLGAAALRVTPGPHLPQ